LEDAMKNEYKVLLTNDTGATFDTGTFASTQACREWASGRGQTFTHGEWYNYTVTIYRNGAEFMEYKTK
jgi:hypothetical protein